MLSLAKYLIILCIAAITIIAACIIAYNKRLDKITSGEVRDTHTAIPEPKTTINAVYKIVLMAITIIAFLTISTMNGRLISMQNTLNNLQSRENQLSHEINYLRELLEQNGKSFVTASWEIAKCDPEKRVVDVIYSVELKEFTDDTAVTLQLGDHELPLTRVNAGTFSGKLEASLFEEYEHSFVCITEGGKTVLEPVDFPQYYFWDYMPMPSFECSFSSDYNMGKLKYDGHYTVLLSNTDDVQTVFVTYMTGGRDIKTIDITDEAMNQKEIILDKGLQLEKDLTFRIEISTATGYKVVEQTVMIYESSADLDGYEFERILDANGNIVWEDGYKH